VPPQEDIDKVIAAADRETGDYLWTMRDTMGRMSEVNRLTWDDIDFRNPTVTFYTRKKRGGHLTPRKVPMTLRLYSILNRRHQQRRKSVPWVFWREYTSSKTGEKKIGPYQERKRLMKTLCKKAGVRYFRFHALRHSGASLMDNSNVPIDAIQRILGHENRKTTEIYLHSIGSTERDTISIFEAATEKSLPKSLPRINKEAAGIG
jgi:integrase